LLDLLSFGAVLLMQSLQVLLPLVQQSLLKLFILGCQLSLHSSLLLARHVNINTACMLF